MKKKLLSLSLVAMFALGAVACGGDDAGTETEGEVIEETTELTS